MPDRNLSYRALYYMLAQLAANAVGFITSMVLARAFTKQEMGDYQQLLMLYTIFSSILIAGLPSCLTYFYPIADEKRKPATVYIVLGLLFFSGVAIGLATFFSAPYVVGHFKDNPRLGMLVCGFFLFCAFTLGGGIFLPVYTLMPHVLKVLKDKDRQLLKDMTCGRFTRPAELRID